MKVWLNSRLVDSRKATISVFDHGFLYGDGIYETVRADNYSILHWPEHYQRLIESARLIALRCPWSSRTLLDRVTRVLKANRLPDAGVRITIARGPGPLGLDPRVCPEPTLAILIHPHRDLEKYRRTGVAIGIPEIRRNHPDCMNPRIKSNNALNTILAKIEGTRMGVFEAVLLNLEGFLTEGTTSNLFFFHHGKLHTPALSCGILAGVTRNWVIQLARKHQIPVQEGRYRLPELLRADEMFLTSSILEIMPVVQVKIAGRSKTYRISARPGPCTNQLQSFMRSSR